MTDLETAKRRLARFAEYEAGGVSPLYERLASEAACDDEVAGLLTAAPDEYATATLFLAAAHRLVLSEPISDLANYYPSVDGSYGVDPVTWTVFRRFVLDREERMRELIANRTTQTNEVRRAALLFPAVAMAAKQAGGPVALLEVGCSAGLLLGMDSYGYRYTTPEDERIAAGPSKTPLVLDCELHTREGARLPKLPKKLPVGARVGLDRAPVDLTDEEQYAWLEACIWADHPERLHRLSQAAALQRRSPPELVTGDAVDDLGAVAARLPDELPIVVLTSQAMPYVTAERRPDFVATLGELAVRRPLWWVGHESYQAGLNLVLPGRDDLAFSPESPLTTLGLTSWQGGEPVTRALARTRSHGEWMEWLV